MNDTAYLVAHLDITQSPPVVQSVGIYSENARGLTMLGHKTCAVDVLKVHSTSFSKAIREVIENVKLHKFLQWTIPFLKSQHEDYFR